MSWYNGYMPDCHANIMSAGHLWIQQDHRVESKHGIQPGKERKECRLKETEKEVKMQERETDSQSGLHAGRRAVGVELQLYSPLLITWIISCTAVINYTTNIMMFRIKMTYCNLQYSM